MNLIYRGIRYQVASQVEVESKPLAGKYRGIAWEKHPHAIAILNLGSTEFKYRGIAYRLSEITTKINSTMPEKEPQFQPILGIEAN
ncbi:DUF4278 domain-containing protein [Geitlerinema sp. PCC 9228]|jgi:hypothetical protein|uniref:DUF4278 domain-containing protein n=1 Tax=Geitlerinema sp. PCC 9228 TaxID=111611 RepID=UPI0008F9A817|nr:DUF4278 domain-containing protein [Geitlerinema sp. PCC 9228]